MSSGPWLAVVASHLVRSFWNWSQPDSLREELAGLRIEVYRARDLLNDFNLVLEGCERRSEWLQLANKFLASVNILLGLVAIIALSWIFCQKQSVPQKAIALTDDSSSEDQPLPLVRGRTGPVRPSDLGKGGKTQRP